MKFSIIVPVYNVELYLAECVNSIMEQSFQDFEVILVDDGSTDKSAQLCDEYAECFLDKIRVIHKKNQGLISARRVGIKEAKGEFCVFIDSDDFVENNLLQVINSYLVRGEDIDIVLYSFQYFRDGRRDNRFKIIAADGFVWSGDTKKELYEKICFNYDITSLCTKSIRTDILKNDPTDYKEYYGKNMAEDLLQSLYPLIAARKIIYTDSILYDYRIVEKSTSHQTSLDSICKKSTIHVYEKLMEYLPIMGLDSENCKKRIAAKWFNDTLYIMSKCYEDAENWKHKKEIIDYDWKKMLPEAVWNVRNEYENIQYQKLYSHVIKKNYYSVAFYFFKKKIYTKWKKRKKKC